MKLAAGTRLSSYEIVAPLGAGGMGEVWRARDTKLGRDVALKLLPAQFADDPARLARFEREAKTLAALNHPNIVTIHSIERADGLQFLTMELVEGGTLAERIQKRGLPFTDILALAIPLADAIGAAHERGVVHRDLKPSNVMLTADGRVKVLDFGLATLGDRSGELETTTAHAEPLTREGNIVGTASYMSPEQAEGRPVDHRSDIFSFGVLLYEMATGERPFTGDTTVSILSAILKDTPRPVTEINPGVPRELSRVVRRCLSKDREYRYQSAKDLRNELQDLKRESESGELSSPAPRPSGVASAPTAPRTRWRRWRTAAVLALVVAAAVLAVVWGRRASVPQTPAAPELTFTQLTFQRGMETYPTLSPDGSWVAYCSETAGDWDIHLLSVGGQNPLNLTRAPDSDECQPAFSPDGARIAFRSDRQNGGIFVMGRTGEFVRRLTDKGYNPAWSPTGEEIVYATESIGWNPYGRGAMSELWVVQVATGATHLLFKGDAVQPRWSPHGHRIAFWARTPGTAQRDLWTIAAAGGTPVAVTQDAATDWNPVWAPDGSSLRFSSDRGGTLSMWRIAIDERTGQPLGSARAETAPSAWVANPSLSADGRRLAYAAVDYTSNLQRFAFDPARARVLDKGTWITTGSYYRLAPDVSPDGRRLVFRSGFPQEDLYISGADGSDPRQLTDDVARDLEPRWSPDGTRIAFYSDRGGNLQIWSIDADGGHARPLTENPGGRVVYPVWSPDGSRMAATIATGAVYGVRLFDPGQPWTQQTPESLPPLPGQLPDFLAFSWSPDGTRLAGGSRDGRVVVYTLRTRAYEILASRTGGYARWMPDGRHVLYMDREGQKLLVVDSVTKATREVLSTAPQFLRSYALSRDGRALYVAAGDNESDIWMAAVGR